MDARLASDAARVGFRFVFGRIGVTPEAASTWFLPRIVGMVTALDLERRCVDDERVPLDTVTVEHSVDVRYAGQSYELTVPWEAGQDLRTRFDAAHEERYGYADQDGEIELVTARVTATAPVTGETRAADLRPGPAPAPVTKRPLYTDQGRETAPVYRREELAADTVLTGPLIIEQLDSTIVVLAGQACRNDRAGFLHLYESESS